MGLFTWLQLASDRWALNAFTSVADVGGYAVLYRMGYAPFLLSVGGLAATDQLSEALGIFARGDTRSLAIPTPVTGLGD
jgi:hypothetical protein